MNTLPKQVLYIDLDNVLVDFQSGIDRLDDATRQQYEGRLDEVPGIFAIMDPMPGAVEAFQTLAQIYDVYILSTAPWENPSAWSDKLQWVKQHLGKAAYKRLILTHHKDLNKGAFLIDDRKKNGADEFEGELLQFGSEQFPDWASVVTYLTPQPKPKSYTNIKEILTLELPFRKDTYLHRVKSENDEAFDEAQQVYEDVINKIIEDLDAGKYGNLGENYEFNPKDGWYEDLQSFTFDFQDFDIIVNVTNVSIDPEYNFNEVQAYIECSVDINNDDVEEPDYMQALEFEQHCEIECLEDALDTLFTEIAKCTARYEEKININ